MLDIGSIGSPPLTYFLDRSSLETEQLEAENSKPSVLLRLIFDSFMIEFSP